MGKRTKNASKTILYSVGLMTDTINHRQLPCATIVERGTLDVDAIASEISHATTLTKTDIVGVLSGFIEFGMKYLASGYRINLGEMGQFFPTLKAHCANSVEECDASTIEKVCCHFRPSKKLTTMLNQSSFERTVSATNRRKAIKASESDFQNELDNQEEG